MARRRKVKKKRVSRKRDEAGGQGPAGKGGPSNTKPSAPKSSGGKATKGKPTKGSSSAGAAKSEAAKSTAPPEKTWLRQNAWWMAVLAFFGLVVGYIELGHSDAGAGVVQRVGLEGPPPAAEQLEVRVLHRYPHDPMAFTQGLLWHDGHIFESTGLYGESSLRRVDLETGEVLERRSLDRGLFAEGLARIGDQLTQLTWRANQAHVWTVDGFHHERQLRYEGEGWGLCHNGEHLVMSDGSERLSFRQPESFRVDHVVRVRDADGFVEDLNELECVDGAIWANVWQTDRIIRIDPATGRVTASVDASGLLDATEALGSDVLNGIAWIPEREHFVITGKQWPWLFEVEFVPAGSDE